MNLKEGMKISCYIDDEFIENAKIHIDGEIFICQNRFCGLNCSNKLGYRFSWTIQDGSELAMSRNRVRKIKILSEPGENENKYKFLFEQA